MNQFAASGHAGIHSDRTDLEALGKGMREFKDSLSGDHSVPDDGDRAQVAPVTADRV